MRSRPRKSRPDYPDGVLAVYDNGGLRKGRDGEWRGSADRYTVVYAPETDRNGETFYPHLAMSEHPFSPVGIGVHGETPFRITRGQGERCIAFEDLPEDCQRAVRQDLAIMSDTAVVEDYTAEDVAAELGQHWGISHADALTAVNTFASAGGDGSGMTLRRTGGGEHRPGGGRVHGRRGLRRGGGSMRFDHYRFGGCGAPIALPDGWEVVFQ